MRRRTTPAGRSAVAPTDGCANRPASRPNRRAAGRDRTGPGYGAIHRTKRR
jgi:hypothetical protein